MSFRTQGGTGLLPSVVRSADSPARNSGNTGSTLTNDDTLLFPIVGDGAAIYLVEAYLVVNAANATMDIKTAWSVPAGCSGYHGGEPLISNIGGWAGVSTGTVPSAISASLASGLTFGTLIGTTGLKITALIFTGTTAGNIVFQWAQATADAGDLKLLKGSLLRITKVG